MVLNGKKAELTPGPTLFLNVSFVVKTPALAAAATPRAFAVFSAVHSNARSGSRNKKAPELSGAFLFLRGSRHFVRIRRRVGPVKNPPHHVGAVVSQRAFRRPEQRRKPPPRRSRPTALFPDCAGHDITGSGGLAAGAIVQATSTAKRKPKLCNNVFKLDSWGFPVEDNIRYRFSRLRKVSWATFEKPCASAMSRSANRNTS